MFHGFFTSNDLRGFCITGGGVSKSIIPLYPDFPDRTADIVNRKIPVASRRRRLAINTNCRYEIIYTFAPEKTTSICL
jgi:hypothetical protein